MNKLMDFCEYILWLFVGNLLFLLTNLPILFFYFLVGFDRAMEYKLLFFLCLLPVGPSFTALLYAMNKLMRNKDVSIRKDFIKGYRLSFRTATKTAALQLFLLLVLATNIESLPGLSGGQLLVPMFKVMAGILVLMSFYLYPLIARYHITVLDALKAALVLVVSRPQVTLGNLLILLFTFVLVELKASYAVLFVVSVLCFLLMYFQRPLFATLEERNAA